MKSKWVHEIEGFENVKGYKVYEDGTVESYKNDMDIDILLVPHLYESLNLTKHVKVI